MRLQMALVIVLSTFGCSPANGTPSNPSGSNPSGSNPSGSSPSDPQTEPNPTGGDPSFESESAVPEGADFEADPEPGAPVGPEVCSSFSFDLRGMPHTGPYEVSEGLIQGRIQGLMHRVRSAEQPTPDTVYYGGSSFQARFSGPNAMAQCGRVRVAIAPPAPPNASRRQQMGRDQATPCVPCD